MLRLVKNEKEPKSFVNYSLLDNGICKINNNYKMFIKVDGGINIDSLSESDYLDILEVFGEVLNSFSTDVQILVITENIKHYEMGIDSTNKNIITYHSNYNKFLRDILKTKTNKKFYIILNKSSSTGHNAYEHLTGQFSYISKILKSVGISVSTLTNNEIINLLNISKISLYKDYAQIDDNYIKIFSIKEYPDRVPVNWMEKLITMNLPISISYHIHPEQTQEVINNIKFNIAKLKSSQDMLIKSGFVESKEINNSLLEAEKMLDRLIMGSDKIFMLGFYISVSGKTLNELRENASKLKNTLDSLQLEFRIVKYSDIKKAVASVLPICEDRLFECYNFDTKSLSSFFPFIDNDLYSFDGVFYGINIKNDTLVVLDRWNLENYNMIVLGCAGSGKSLFVKLETCKQLIKNTQVIIVDHFGEYKKLADVLGGKYYEEIYNINWNNKLIVLGGADKVKSLTVAWNHIKKTNLNQRKLLIIDEFWEILLLYPNLILEVIKLIRHYNSGLTCITQNVIDFLKSKEGRVVFDNSSLKLFLKLGETDMEEAKKIYNFTSKEEKFLRGCKPGNGLLVWGNNRIKLNIPCSDDDLSIFTTKI